MFSSSLQHESTLAERASATAALKEQQRELVEAIQSGALGEGGSGGGSSRLAMSMMMRGADGSRYSGAGKSGDRNANGGGGEVSKFGALTFQSLDSARQEKAEKQRLARAEAENVAKRIAISGDQNLIDGMNPIESAQRKGQTVEKGNDSDKVDDTDDNHNDNDNDDGNGMSTLSHVMAYRRTEVDPDLAALQARVDRAELSLQLYLRAAKVAGGGGSGAGGAGAGGGSKGAMLLRAGGGAGAGGALSRGAAGQRAQGAASVAEVESALEMLLEKVKGQVQGDVEALGIELEEAKQKHAQLCRDVNVLQERVSPEDGSLRTALAAIKEVSRMPAVPLCSIPLYALFSSTCETLIIRLTAIFTISTLT